jgi:hypothetical protein
MTKLLMEKGESFLRQASSDLLLPSSKKESLTEDSDESRISILHLPDPGKKEACTSDAVATINGPPSLFK